MILSLGDAFLDIHANTSPFKTELAAGVRAAITETEATAAVRVRAATGSLAGTTTTNTVRTVADTSAVEAAAKAQAAILAQESRDFIANLDVEAAAQRDFEAVRVAEAQHAAAALKAIRAELTATVESEALQERAIAAETASIETQYRKAVAAAAAQAQAEIRATVESEAIQERAVAAETASIETQYRQAVVAAAKQASAEIAATVDAEARQEEASYAATVAAFRDAQAQKVAAAREANKAIAAQTAAAGKAGTAIQTAATAAIAGVGLTTVAVIGASITSAFTFQQAVNKVINLSQNFGQTAAQVTATVLDQSKKTGVAAIELADAYYKIAAAGYAGKTAQDLLAESAKLSALGLGESAKVADALVSVINNYGSANITAAKASSTFLSIIQNSKFTPDELAGSLGRVLSVAQQLGVSFPEVGAAIAALSHSTSSTADTAVTGLQALITNLIQATKSTGAASKELKTLGLSGQGLLQDLGTHGVIATLDEIRKAFEKHGVQVKTTEAQYQDLATNLGESLDQVKKQFGKIDLGQLQKLFPNRKGFLTFLGLTDENNLAARTAATNVATGAANNVNDALKRQLGSSSGQIKLALTGIKDDFIQLGDFLLPTVVTVFGKIQDAIKLGQDPNSSFHKFLVTLGQDLKDIGIVAVPILKGIAGAFVTIVQDAKPFLDILAAIARNSAGQKLFEFAGFLIGISLAVKGISGAAAIIDGLAASLTRLAGAETAAAAAGGGAAAGGLLAKLGLVGLGVGGAGVAASLGLGFIPDQIQTISDKVTDAQKKTQAYKDGLAILRKEVQGQSKDFHDSVAAILISNGSIQEAQRQINAYSTSKAGAQLTDLQRAAIATANALIFPTTTPQINVNPAIAALQLLLNDANATAAQIAAALNAAGGGANGLANTTSSVQNRTAFPGSTGSSTTGFGNFPGIHAPSPLAGQTLPTSGGGGGSKGKTAAQTAADNFASSIKSALTTVQDAIAGFATATEATVESTLEALAKSITAAFKTAKKTEPSALVKLLADDTKQLESLATQRDKLTKSIADADSFAASTLTSGIGTGSLTTIAGTLSIFAKTAVDLSKLRLVLPGDPAALSGPAAQQAKVDLLKKSLNDRVIALQDFQQNIQAIIHEGLNAGAVQDLIAGGVETNGGLAKALASATPAQIAALNASQAAITATAKKLAANAGDAAAQAGVDAGKAVADGILQGLKDKNASLLQAMTKLADALVNQIKKDLKIHSPSRIMRDMGVHVGTGLEHGILSTHGAIQVAAAGMARSATPSIASFDMPGALGSANGSFGPVSTTTHNQQREIHAPVTIHAYGGGASADQIAAAHGRMIAKALR